MVDEVQYVVQVLTPDIVTGGQPPDRADEVELWFSDALSEVKTVAQALAAIPCIVKRWLRVDEQKKRDKRIKRIRRSQSIGTF